MVYPPAASGSKLLTKHSGSTWSCPRSVKVMLLDTQLIAFFSRHQTILEPIWEGIKFSSSSMAETILLPSQLKMSQLLNMQSFGLWASQKWLLQYCYLFAYRFCWWHPGEKRLCPGTPLSYLWITFFTTLLTLQVPLPRFYELPSCQSSNDNSLRIFLTMFAKSRKDSSWKNTHRTVWLYM